LGELYVKELTMTKAHSTLKITVTKIQTVKPPLKHCITVGYSPNGGNSP